MAATVTGVAGVASAAGNNGTVKLGSAGVAFTNSNDPHLTCPIQIQWTGFDAGSQHYDITFTGINPTGGTVTPATDSGDFADGAAVNTKIYSLSFAGATPNNKGEYHVGIDINTTAASGSDFKQKTIWVKDCAANAGGTVTVTGACNTAGNGYDWTVTATPTTAGANSAVSGTWTKQGDAAVTGPFSTNAAGTGSFSTPDGANQLNLTLSTAQWTLTATTATATACAALPSALQLSAACSAPGSGTVLWTVANPNSDQATAVSATGSNVSNGPSATIAGNSNTTFTTPAPSASRVVHGTVNGHDVTSNSVSFGGACAPGQVETPASVSFTSDCAGINGVFTSADLHSTQFVVTAPDGTTDSFTGSANRSYAADSSAGHLSVDFDGNTETYDWVEPKHCNPPPPGQADPGATGDNSCVDGISVVLSNINGTADVTFTVVDPAGDTHQVPVRAGALKKESYAVAEDTTGVVTVDAPGMAKQKFTYAKNCTKVLGEKNTHKPPKTIVEGEHAVRTPTGELPYTGYQTKRELQTAAGLMLLGALLCGLASIRRRTTD